MTDQRSHGEILGAEGDVAPPSSGIRALVYVSLQHEHKFLSAPGCHTLMFSHTAASQLIACHTKFVIMMP
jgi:hypothetical protein